jgi:hypothetical protein
MKLPSEADAFSKAFGELANFAGHESTSHPAIRLNTILFRLDPTRQKLSRRRQPQTVASRGG